MTVFQEIFRYHQYALPVPAFCVRKPRYILDGGAYNGTSSVFFTVMFPEAEIVSLEPEESNFQLLEANAERFPNIRPFKKALWGSQQYLKVSRDLPPDSAGWGFDSEHSKWHFRMEEASAQDGADAVEGQTISDVMADRQWPRIDILKLDIEGAEKEIFENEPDSWLKDTGIIMIELHDEKKPGCSDSFFEATDRYDFKQFVRGETVILIRKTLLLQTVTPFLAAVSAARRVARIVLRK